MGQWFLRDQQTHDRTAAAPVRFAGIDIPADMYFALDLTSTTGHTAEMHRDEAVPFGFTIHEAPLEPPVPGNIEAAFADTGLGLSVADLRQARAENLNGPDRMRMQSVYVDTPVLDAFDGILSAPASTITDLEKS